MKSRLAISGKVRWVARYGSSRSSAPVRLIAQAPAEPGGRLDAVAQLARIVDEEAQVGAELEHPLGLGEDSAGGGRLAEREMGAYELEPDLDGEPGKAVVEQWPQTVGARQRGACVIVSPLVECDACRRDISQRAPRVVAEARLLDEGQRRPRVSPASPQAPCSAARSESCACAT